MLSGDVPCRVLPKESSSSRLICLTSRSPRAQLTVDTVTVRIDSLNRTLNAKFTFTADPRVTGLRPRASINSGGRALAVTGTDLHSIQSPKLYLIDPIQLREQQKLEGGTADGAVLPLASDLGDCSAVNATFMWCDSPKMLAGVRKRRSPDQVDNGAPVDLTLYPQWPIGFKMDAVESVANLGDQFQLTVVPDPSLKRFLDGRKLYRGNGDEPLVLEGDRLTLAATVDDVRVFIGRQQCNITAIVPRQLVCIPPARQPLGTDLEGRPLEDARPMVTVLIGNLRFELGQLAYETADGLAFVQNGMFDRVSFLTPTIVGTVVVAIALLLLVFLIYVAVWWRRKSWQVLQF